MNQTLSNQSRLIGVCWLSRTFFASAARLAKASTRAAREPLLSYNFSRLTDADRFSAVISRFEETIANSQVMESSL